MTLGPTGAVDLVTLEETKTHLNITSTNRDTVLQTYIDACSAAVTDITGPVAQATFSNEYHDGGDITIYVRNPPLLTVTSLTELVGFTVFTLTLQPPGQAVDNFGFSIDQPEMGEITRRSAGSTPYPFAGGVRYPGLVQVSYTSGLASVPPNVKLGTLELIRHLWEFGQQGARPLYGAGADEGDTHLPVGFFIPNRVREMLEPNLKPPVIA